jgi:hypothetical protein
VPVHRRLIEFGFLEYVAERRKNGSIKLFPELLISTTGYYSDPFSKWYVRFLKSCGASRPRTSYHSFNRTINEPSSVEGHFAEAISEAKKLTVLKRSVKAKKSDKKNRPHPALFLRAVGQCTVSKVAEMNRAGARAVDADF